VRTGPYTAVQYNQELLSSEGSPIAAKKAFGSARLMVGVLLILHGPFGLPQVCAARFDSTLRFRNSAYRFRPLFQWRHAKALSRRRIH
jgi:hypothetical protein